MRLKDKVAIITGGSRGIGFATADKFLKEGASVVLAASSQESADVAVDKLKEKYPNAIVAGISPNLASMESVRKAFKEATEKYGCVDILVNNAGIGSVSLPFEEITDEQWEQMIKVDLTAPFYVCREVIPYMKEQKHGKIINISSGSGIIGCEFCSHYASAKAGLIGFTQSIAKELAMDRINVNVIAVPTTQTPMLKETEFDIFVEDELRDIPWGRIGVPEDIADMVLYLSSDSSEYVTGQILAPNGGRRTPI